MDAIVEIIRQNQVMSIVVWAIVAFIITVVLLQTGKAGGIFILIFSWLWPVWVVGSPLLLWMYIVNKVEEKKWEKEQEILSQKYKLKINTKQSPNTDTHGRRKEQIP